MFNKIILMGRLTRDVELKTTTNGISVASFSIAVDRRFQGKGEEKKTDFINCVAWRQTAEFISKYFGKGRCILVEGELQTRTYDDKDGVKRYVSEVIVSQASFTGEKKVDSVGANNSDNSATNYTPASGNDVVTKSDDDEEYPF